MEIEKVKISTVKRNPNNPRHIADENFDKLVASIKSFPEMLDLRPIIVNDDMVVLGGNMRLKACKKAGLKEVPIIKASDLTEKQQQEFIIKDNVGFGEWDWEMLNVDFDAQELTDWGLDVPDFEPEVILEAEEDDFDAPEGGLETDIVLGDLIEIGEHRLMCGDSTDSDMVAKLMDGNKADLIHADPPYGMGKEKDGVLNDNIYGENLDKFQMDWWNSFFPFLIKNGSAYIWGNAPDLFRLWFNGGLSEFGELRNEIVWDKNNIPGMKSDLMTQYPEASERCLFIQFGNLHQGSVNSYDYFEEWDNVRLYLEKEAKKNNLTNKILKELCNCEMYSHWFTKSQWTMIPEKHYKSLNIAFPDSFQKKWSELKLTHDKAQKNYRGMVNKDRPYFDNTHDAMTDVWKFGRSVGEDRHGHATPKPIDMMQRPIKSSCPINGLIIEPFLGSGSTMVASHQLERKCYGMELDPRYCQVIINRMVKLDPDLIVKINGEVYSTATA